MMILACGSRGWDNDEAIYHELRKFPPNKTTKIIHGGAKGADCAAGIIADDLGMSVEVFLADWKTYGKSAGIKRNIRMLDERPDMVLAFWDGESRGTKHTIVEALKRGIPTRIIGLSKVIEGKPVGIGSRNG